MDIELAKSLEQLEVKKKTVNTESDLTKECMTIIELDHRIGLLLKEVKNLRNSIDEQSAFICNNCDQIEPNYNVLRRASRVFDLASELTKLNRLCRRFNNSDHIFKFLANDTDQNQVIPESVVRRASLTKKNGHTNEDDELTGQILNETIEKFESIYQPLEAILSKRNDLPYATYANKVRRLKLFMSKNNITTSDEQQHLKQDKFVSN